MSASEPSTPPSSSGNDPPPSRSDRSFDTLKSASFQERIQESDEQDEDSLVWTKDMRQVVRLLPIHDDWRKQRGPDPRGDGRSPSRALQVITFLLLDSETPSTGISLVERSSTNLPYLSVLVRPSTEETIHHRLRETLHLDASPFRRERIYI